MVSRRLCAWLQAWQYPINYVVSNSPISNNFARNNIFRINSKLSLRIPHSARCSLGRLSHQQSDQRCRDVEKMSHWEPLHENEQFFPICQKICVRKNSMPLSLSGMRGSIQVAWFPYQSAFQPWCWNSFLHALRTIPSDLNILYHRSHIYCLQQSKQFWKQIVVIINWNFMVEFADSFKETGG